MKINIISVFFLVLLLGLNSYPSLANDAYDRNIKGPVITIREYNCDYRYVFGEYEKTSMSNSYLLVFNKLGNIVGQGRGDTISSENIPIRYCYDNERLVNRLELYFSKVYKKEFNQMFVQVDTFELRDYTYEDDKLVSVIGWSGNRTKRYQEKYHYFNNGYEVTAYSNYGYKVDYFWSIDMSKKTIMFEQDGWTYFGNYSFSANRPTRVTCKHELDDIKGVVRKGSQIYYNQNGDVIQIDGYIGSMPINKEEGLMGNVAEGGEYHLHFEYEYDSYGNWTKRLCYDGERLVYWKERVYTYAKQDSEYEEIWGKERNILANQDLMVTKYKESIQESIIANDEFEELSIQPKFPGGDEALAHYLSKSVKYPPVCAEEGIQGRVFVSCIVDCNGIVKNATIIKSVHPALDKEALRVVNAMPTWSPGKNKDGVACPAKIVIPISFSLM